MRLRGAGVRLRGTGVPLPHRTQAVLWGVGHGFTPDHHSIDHWLGGP